MQDDLLPGGLGLALYPFRPDRRRPLRAQPGAVHDGKPLTQFHGCQSDTCTAVTLYSGQFVAQSEFSVVMTLAPDTG